MATAIGNLVINLSANTSRYGKGLLSAQGLTGRFVGAVRGAMSTVLRFGSILAGVGGAGGVAGFAILIKSKMAAIDAAAKLSRQIGITTEQLAGLRHAAELTTTGGTELLDKSLKFMSKNLGEAIGGVGEAKDALELLHLSATDLVQMTPDVAFRRIADAMQGLGSQSEKSYVATKLFGRAGGELVNTLALGTKGLDEMQAEAERLGLTFSMEAAMGVEAANDAMTKFRSATGAFGTQAAIQLAPFIQLLADKLTGSIIDANRAIDDGTTKTKGFAAEFGVLGAAVLETANAMQSLKKAYIEFSLAVLKFISGPARGATILGERLGVEARQDIKDVRADIEGLELTLRDMEKEKSWGELLAESVRETQAALTASNGAAQDLRDTLADIGTDGSFLDPVDPSSVIRQWQQDLENFGKTARQIQLEAALAAIPGDDPFTRKRLQDLFDELSRRQVWQEPLAGWAEDMFAGKGPEQKAIPDMLEEVQQRDRFAAAAGFGTQEAYSAILAAMTGREGDTEKVAQRTRTEQLRQQQETNKKLDLLIEENRITIGIDD